MQTYYIEYLDANGKDRELFVKANNTQSARAEAQSQPDVDVVLTAQLAIEETA